MKKLSLALTAVLFAGAVHAASPAAKSKLEQIFTFEMLGSDIAYLQKYTGVPKETYGNSRVYRVGQCTVTAYASDKSVKWLELEVSQKCTFDFGKMFGSTPGKVWAHQLTFGKAQDILRGELGEAHFSADCLSMCGNAADPSVYATWESGARDAVVRVRLGTELVDDKAVDASSKWEEHMIAKEGENYVTELTFNESDKYDGIAARLFHDVPVKKIRINEGPYEGPYYSWD